MGLRNKQFTLGSTSWLLIKSCKYKVSVDVCSLPDRWRGRRPPFLILLWHGRSSDFDQNFHAFVCRQRKSASPKSIETDTFIGISVQLVKNDVRKHTIFVFFRKSIKSISYETLRNTLQCKWKRILRQDIGFSKSTKEIRTFVSER